MSNFACVCHFRTLGDYQQEIESEPKIMFGLKKKLAILKYFIPEKNPFIF